MSKSCAVCKKSGVNMDDADDGSIQAFVRGMRYAYAFQEANKND